MFAVRPRYRFTLDGPLIRRAGSSIVVEIRFGYTARRFCFQVSVEARCGALSRGHSPAVRWRQGWWTQDETFRVELPSAGTGEAAVMVGTVVEGPDKNGAIGSVLSQPTERWFYIPEPVPLLSALLSNGQARLQLGIENNMASEASMSEICWLLPFSLVERGKMSRLQLHMLSRLRAVELVRWEQPRLPH